MKQLPIKIFIRFGTRKERNEDLFLGILCLHISYNNRSYFKNNFQTRQLILRQFHNKNNYQKYFLLLYIQCGTKEVIRVVMLLALEFCLARSGWNFVILRD